MIDFEKQFSDFCSQPSGGSNIAQSVYSILPWLSKQERRTLDSMKYFADKYDLPEIHEFVSNYERISKVNKNLSFMEQQSVKQLLKSMTLQEMIPQVNVASSRRIQE